MRDRFMFGGCKMAADRGEGGPPYSLQSMSSCDSEQDNMDILRDNDCEEEQNQEVFVLREKKGVIYPLDYKYRVGEFGQLRLTCSWQGIRFRYSYKEKANIFDCRLSWHFVNPCKFVKALVKTLGSRHTP